MIYKGRKPSTEKPHSNMRRVLRMIEDGYTDRAEIADQLGLTKSQVTNAIENLRADGLIEPIQHRFCGIGKGRLDSIYKVAGQYIEQPSPFAHISFVFWFGKDSTARG